jgi:titin
MSADNARSMNNAAATVAAFRASKTSTVAPSSPTLPAAPSSLSATAASSSAINLKWTDNATNETGYVVQRSTDGTSFSQVATLGAGTSSYSSTGLSAAKKYYFRVRAYNGAGDSAFSNTASATTSSTSTTTIPAKPTNVAAVNLSGGSARVTWTDKSTNETYFQVYRQKWSSSTSSWGSGTTVVKTGANVVSYVDTPGVGTFRYKVRAGNASGYTVYVTSASVKVTK